MGEKIMDGFPSREEALADFFAAWEPRRSEEYVPLDEAVGRVLARDMTSSNTLPVVRASAFDGLAVKSAAFANGLPDTRFWKRGVDYERADTGDDFPDDFDAVVMIEKADVRPDGSVVFDDDVRVKAGSGVRPAGSTIAAGTPLMKAGSIVRPTDLAVLAMGGAAMAPVRAKPRVAFVPTGSELVPAGVKPRRGQNVDANSLMVKHLLLEYGADPLMFPLVYDDPAEVASAFEAALSSADAVVLGGGSARGEEDCSMALLEKRAQVVHHYIAAVPGRPLMMAVADGKPVVNLPGPTIAAYFGSEWCLQAITARILGIPLHKRPTLQARADAARTSPKNMAFIGRADVTRRNGKYLAHFHDFKDGELAACMASNAQRVSPIGEGGWEKGDLLVFELLRGRESIEER